MFGSETTGWMAQQFKAAASNSADNSETYKSLYADTLSKHNDLVVRFNALLEDYNRNTRKIADLEVESFMRGAAGTSVAFSLMNLFEHRVQLSPLLLNAFQAHVFSRASHEAVIEIQKRGYTISPQTLHSLRLTDAVQDRAFAKAGVTPANIASVLPLHLISLEVKF